MVDNITQRIPTGNYVVFDGDRTDFNAIQINLGQMEALKPFVDKGNVKLNYHVFIEDWSLETCLNETKRYINLANETPSAIIASSDKLALGAITALKEYQLEGKVYVTGMDADLEACKRIYAGTQTLSIYKPFKQLALLAAETAVNVAKTGKLPSATETLNNGFKDVPGIFLEPVAVTKENMKETMAGNGMFDVNLIFEQK